MLPVAFNLNVLKMSQNEHPVATQFKFNKSVKWCLSKMLEQKHSLLYTTLIQLDSFPFLGYFKLYRLKV